jgi:hypothetical protein
MGALRGAALLDSKNFEAGCNSTKNNFAESKTEQHGAPAKRACKAGQCQH